MKVVEDALVEYTVEAVELFVCWPFTGFSPDCNGSADVIVCAGDRAPSLRPLVYLPASVRSRHRIIRIKQEHISGRMEGIVGAGSHWPKTER